MPDQPLPQDQLQALVALFSHNRFGDAIAQANALTKTYPNAAQLYNIIGAAHAGLGQTQDALASYHKSIETNPAYAEAHSNLGATLFKLARYPESAEAFEKALSISPSHPQASANLGAALCKLGRYEKAAATLQRALQINPNNADALGSLGVALKELGQPAEAVDLHRRAIALRPGHAADHNNLGAALAAAGQHESALTAYRDALQIDAGDTDTLNNLGNLLLDMGRMTQALSCFHKALKVNPDNPQALNNLGVALAMDGAHQQALAQFDAALEHTPNFAEAQDNRGLALYHLGRHEEAAEAFSAALRSAPRYAPAMANLGTVLNDLGQRQAAIAKYEQALALRPARAETHHSLARIKTFKPDDPQIATMLDQLNHPHLRPADRMHLEFALGKAMEDLGNYDEAFTHFATANSLRKSVLGYDPAQDDQLFARLKSAFSGTLPSHTNAPRGPVRPIFILGMPRSGTSLVEQILASHSLVHGAGELPCLETAIRASGWDSGAPSAEMLNGIGATYRAEIARRGHNARYVTDKLPLNFRWIGFILHAMPDARVVHVKRDARATCWSIFKHYFATTGSRFGYDLHDLVAYYRRYHDLMAFWTRRFPGRIIELDYDRLTENQEPETRALLDAVGLPWQDQCLRFHKTERRVSTASAHQVRKEMYSGSSQQWRHYEKFLAPAFSALEGL